jgi:shikimate dehydrogenase
MAQLKKVGLIGWPADYSLSPAMHNAAFQALGLNDWHYDLIPTAPNELKAVVASLRDKGYIGANVTVPHKQTIIPLLSSVVMSAQGANAVNTLVWDNNRFQGHNTDVIGIRADLEAHGIPLKGTKTLVLGAGGAAHAAVLALANAGANVTVMNRHTDRAWELYRTVRRSVSNTFNVIVREKSELAKVAPDTELIINCTPAGMYPLYTELSPWESQVPIPAGAIVYDMVYRPQVTRLMQQALDAGARAIGGLGMLVQQGAAAFYLWTGQEPDLAVMRQAAQAELDKAPDQESQE